MHEPERTSWGLQGYKPNIKHQKYKKGFKSFSSFINAEYNISLTVKSEEKKNLKGTYSLSLCLFRTCPEPINSKMALEIKYGWGGTLCPRAWEVWPLGWVRCLLYQYPKALSTPRLPHTLAPTPKGSGDPPTFETVSVIKPSASAKDTLNETQARFSVQAIFLSRCVAVAWDKNIKHCKFSSNRVPLFFFSLFKDLQTHKKTLLAVTEMKSTEQISLNIKHVYSYTRPVYLSLPVVLQQLYLVCSLFYLGQWEILCSYLSLYLCYKDTHWVI